MRQCKIQNIQSDDFAIFKIADAKRILLCKINKMRNRFLYKIVDFLDCLSIMIIVKRNKLFA